MVKYDILSRRSEVLSQIKPFDVLLHLATFAETETNSHDLDRVNDVGTERLLESLRPLLPGSRVISPAAWQPLTGPSRITPPRMRITRARPGRVRAIQARTSPSSNGVARRSVSSGPSLPAFRPFSDRIIGRVGFRPDCREPSPGNFGCPACLARAIGLVYVDDVVNVLITLAFHEASRNSLLTS